MTQLHNSDRPKRGRLFPERTISPTEKAKRQAEANAFHQRGRLIFEQIRLQLIQDHYNWFILIEPDSGDYFVAPNSMSALQQALQKHPQGQFAAFRLNETGVCGRI
ncbi:MULTISPECIES: hypothetical protein [Nostocales]|uniref:Uncharacterized protein n=3 Tax=Nostocales TaxID=1161 RepID=A0A0C1R7M6_9CYAN|nr:hypothetical protein [Tolypothrix bouteillei]KAF3887582.1 hypothetical protein DA73_0400020385 [Tolypothrix bouteillei VB521301]